jgi:hypothetical protein
VGQDFSLSIVARKAGRLAHHTYLERLMKNTLLLLLALLCITSVAESADKPPLKLAIIAPVEPWDRQEGIEAFRDWLSEHYRVEITWIEPATHQPTNETPEAERKAYYQNPPAIPDLAKAREADVIYTALTHVSLNEADSAEYLKLLATKPIIGGRRCHHSINLRVAKDGRTQGAAMDAFALEMFGGKYAGHHGGPIRFKEGTADHSIVKGLDELVKLSLTDRGYKHVIADDVKVLVESHEGQPQVWVREKKGDKPRVFYFVHDPRDLQQHEVVRQMIARALFWATERNEADYRND